MASPKIRQVKYRSGIWILAENFRSFIFPINNDDLNKFLKVLNKLECTNWKILLLHIEKLLYLIITTWWHMYQLSSTGKTRILLPHTEKLLDLKITTRSRWHIYINCEDNHLACIYVEILRQWAYPSTSKSNVDLTFCRHEHHCNNRNPKDLAKYT